MAVKDSSTRKEIASRATKPKELTRELIMLDFTEYTLIELLGELRDLAASGQINGLIFSARYSNPAKGRNLSGAAGRYVHNTDEALGAATLLQWSIAKLAGGKIHD